MDCPRSGMIEAIVAGEAKTAAAMAASLASGALAPEEIAAAVAEAMAEVGRRFETGEFYLPEMLVAAEAAQGCLGVIAGCVGRGGGGRLGTVVLGSVQGDQHDIGKNLVGMFLRSAGFEVVDAGVDVSPEDFARLIVEHEADLLGMSALLTTTMPAMGRTVALLTERGLRPRVKVLVGGAPVTDGFAARIGADGYAPNAPLAARAAKALIRGGPQPRPDTGPPGGHVPAAAGPRG
ncbi:MAG: cobalamin-dependent protein [Acetobacteraceae bacterium]|nr:cobalamin-dependent protein [Acetobacteraceae bacterium]